MLTVFLLVVLGGGAGLFAVWAVDPDHRPRLGGRPGLGSLRATLTGHTTGPPTESGSGVPIEVVEAPTAPDRSTVAVEATPPAGPARRRRRGDVPAAFTAVEGSYRDVAVVPVWRKALSLVLLLAVLFGMGVGLAAITAAGLGVAAELVDGAIG